MRIIGSSSGTVPTGHIPFTARAKKVLEMALREALGLGHNYIGTSDRQAEVRRSEGVGAQVLIGLGVTLDETRAKVSELLSRYEPGGPGPLARAWSVGTTALSPGLEQALKLASSLAGSAVIGTQHLLAVFARDEGLLAHRLLHERHERSGSLAQPPEESDVAGTLDETPVTPAAAIRPRP